MNQIRWDGTEPLATTVLVADLEESVQTLFFELRQLDGGYALLRLLNLRRNSVLTADDLAYYLRQPERAVEANLRRLVELGWARRVDVVNWSWFGLTDDPQRREIVQSLIAWEELWQTRLNQFQRLIDGVVIQPMVLPWDKVPSIPDIWRKVDE